MSPSVSIYSIIILVLWGSIIKKSEMAIITTRIGGTYFIFEFSKIIPVSIPNIVLNIISEI